MKKEKITKIFLVRHAESKFNPGKIYSSKPENDPGLTKKGEWMSKKLAERMNKENIDIIYSSNLPRCILTASFIASAVKKKIIVDSDFREHDVGKCELMSEKEIKKKYPVLAKKWFGEDVSTLVIGESMKTAYSRVLNAFERISEKYEGKNFVIITHQAPVKFVVGKLFDGLKHFGNFGIANASVTLIQKTGKKYKLQYLNDTYHLK